MYVKKPPPEDFNKAGFMPETVRRLKEDSRATLDPETLLAMSDAYDEGIRYVDDGLATVFNTLKSLGLYDNTLIIITADHGEEFMEHGLLGHGESLFDEVIRVPLIVKFPCPGPHCSARTVTSQVELVDIFPTVMRTVGMEPPERLVGRNLSDPAADSRVAYSELEYSITLRTPEWKLIYDEQRDSGELFNLKEDPRERSDQTSTEIALRKLLLGRVLDFGATHQRGVAAGADAIEADEAMLENLKALGYVK
jgi:arylsulfatase A-like enzyme